MSMWHMEFHGRAICYLATIDRICSMAVRSAILATAWLLVTVLMTLSFTCNHIIVVVFVLVVVVPSSKTRSIRWFLCVVWRRLPLRHVGWAAYASQLRLIGIGQFCKSARGLINFLPPMHWDHDVSPMFTSKRPLIDYITSAVSLVWWLILPVKKSRS